VVDGGGLVWPLLAAQPSLSRPLSLNGHATGVASDDTSVYVALSGPPQLAIVALNSGQVAATIGLPGTPGIVRLDAGLGRAFVSAPEQQSLAIVDVGARSVVGSVPGLGQVTGVAVDSDAHQVYLASFGGTVSVVDGASGEKTNVFQLTGDGLTDVAVASGRVYAVNTPGMDLSILDLGTGQVAHRALEEQPTAVATDAGSGLVYVVEGGSLVRFDLQGTQHGRVLLPGVGAPVVEGVPGDQISVAADGSVYVIRPAERTLWLARADAFGP